LTWFAFVFGSFAVVIVLTSKGLLGTKEFDQTGVPCKCRGIAGGKDMEADWLVFIAMLVVFKWFLYQPVILLLGTYLHLRSANKLAVKMQRYKRANSSATSSSGGLEMGSIGGGVDVDNIVENPMRKGPSSSSVSPQEGVKGGQDNGQQVAVDPRRPSWRDQVCPGGEEDGC
jgi:hypothetical protein